MNGQPRVAVLVPCFNEVQTIGLVVSAFYDQLPGCVVYVYDNASTDGTGGVAKKAGAIVCTEPNKGKGNVIRRMFADVDADIYVMVDGDATYDATLAPALIQKLLDENLDMVVGTRQAKVKRKAYPNGHVFGNLALTGTVSLMFRRGFTDMLSGYRVMSHRFVKTFPAISRGFEIETEITVHALQVGASFREIETPYDSRPEGSESKLNTWSDGFRILRMILILFKELKPFVFFGMFFLFLAGTSVAFSLPLVLTWLKTGLVPRFPTAILSTGLMVLAFVSLSAGIILDSLSRARLEVKRLQYLSFSSVSSSSKQSNKAIPKSKKYFMNQAQQTIMISKTL
jgi:glycosyltransferase involved in cell wall biosynthesis